MNILLLAALFGIVYTTTGFPNTNKNVMDDDPKEVAKLPDVVPESDRAAIDAFVAEPGDYRVEHKGDSYDDEEFEVEPRSGASKHRISKRGSIGKAIAEKRLWPEQTVAVRMPMEPEFDADQRKVFQKAVKEIEDNTCIKFKSVNGHEAQFKNYINVVGSPEKTIEPNKTGCWAVAGRVPSLQPQPLVLPEECWTKGTILHELLHALGMLHEHQRRDRDQYIYIVGEDRKDDDFKINEDAIDTTAYDYLSIMHYGEYTSNEDIAIVTKDPKFQELIGARQCLSPTDISELNKLYECPPNDKAADPNITSCQKQENYFLAVLPSGRKVKSTSLVFINKSNGLYHYKDPVTGEKFLHTKSVNRIYEEIHSKKMQAAYRKLLSQGEELPPEFMSQLTSQQPSNATTTPEQQEQHPANSTAEPEASVTQAIEIEFEGRKIKIPLAELEKVGPDQYEATIPDGRVLMITIQLSEEQKKLVKKPGEGSAAPANATEPSSQNHQPQQSIEVSVGGQKIRIPLAELEQVGPNQYKTTLPDGGVLTITGQLSEEQKKLVKKPGA